MNPLTSAYGAAPSYSILNASYYDPTTQQVVTLADASVGSGNLVTVNDGVGGRANFTVAPRNSSLSSAQQLRVGVYALGVSGAVTENSQNFSDTITLVGAHTVNAKPLAVVSTNGVSKIYDGTTSMAGANFVLGGVAGGAGVANGDGVTAMGSGDYITRNAGNQLSYVVNNLSLSGADASNYYIATGSSFSGNNGTITPRSLTLKAMPDSKMYDGTTGSFVKPVSDALAQGDSLSGLVQSFDSSAVGVRSLSVSAYTLHDGNGGSNYVVTRAPATGGIWSQESPPPSSPRNTLSVAAPITLGNEAMDTSSVNINLPPVLTLAAMVVNEQAEVMADQTALPVNCAQGVVRAKSGIRVAVDGQAHTSKSENEQSTSCLNVQVVRPVAHERGGVMRVYVSREALNSDAEFVFFVTLPVSQNGVLPKATLHDGSALPDWLSLDAKEIRFTASKVPPGALPLTMRVEAGPAITLVDVLETSRP